MKKILFTTLALLTIVLTATAQETREKVSRNRISAQISFAQKFMLIKLDKKNEKTWYAVMSYPVTYYNYYAVYGKNVKPQGRDINDVMMMGDKKKRDFAADAAKLYSGLSFHVATATELQRALGRNYNVASENGPYSHATNGFDLACPYSTYLRMKKLIKAYRDQLSSPPRRTNSHGNGVG